MQFKGKMMHSELAKHAAKEFDFPQNKLDMDFSKGLPKPNWGSKEIPQTSSSYVWMDVDKSIEELADQMMPLLMDGIRSSSNIIVE